MDRSQASAISISSTGSNISVPWIRGSLNSSEVGWPVIDKRLKYTGTDTGVRPGAHLDLWREFLG